MDIISCIRIVERLLSEILIDISIIYEGKLALVQVPTLYLRRLFLFLTRDLIL